ncbi:hypothetical protein MBRU_09020 [Mycolicibacterium brumae DSM 44177]|nr:hypothetical protein MBRU_09020 [Mycolicibacterium brumae DSM 44177]
MTVVGSVNMDLVFDVAALPAPGETVLASGLHRSPGGKGGNQAVAAARAGAQVSVVAAVGEDDAGSALIDHLRANGVATDAVTRLPGPSGTAAIVVGAAETGSRENTIVVAPGANAHLTLDDKAVRDVVAAADVVLVQLEIPAQTALAAARQGRHSGATVILNASPAGADPDLLAELAAVTDVVIVNETEAQQWHWQTPYLVTTRGAAGATVASDGGTVSVPSQRVEPADTSGAGDVFAGVLAACWTRMDPEQAVRRATAAGALATLVPGAGDCAPTAEMIEDALLR